MPAIALAPTDPAPLNASLDVRSMVREINSRNTGRRQTCLSREPSTPTSPIPCMTLRLRPRVRPSMTMCPRPALGIGVRGGPPGDSRKVLLAGGRTPCKQQRLSRSGAH